MSLNKHFFAMKALPAAATLTRIHRLDQFLCLRFNRVRRPGAILFWLTISRIGDGYVWFALMAGLPLAYGWQELRLSLRMAAVGAFSIALYLVIKRLTARQRPYEVHDEILQLGAVLDRHAFPSGHTIHAVAFAVLVGTAHPTLLWLLIPFGLLTALSRIVLGLHYPSDVVAGAVLGASIAWVSQQF